MASSQQSVDASLSGQPARSKPTTIIGDELEIAPAGPPHITDSRFLRAPLPRTTPMVQSPKRISPTAAEHQGMAQPASVRSWAVSDDDDFSSPPPPGSPLESAWRKMVLESHKILARGSHSSDDDDDDDEYLYMAAPRRSPKGGKKKRGAAGSGGGGKTAVLTSSSEGSVTLSDLSQPPTPTTGRDLLARPGGVPPIRTEAATRQDDEYRRRHRNPLDTAPSLSCRGNTTSPRLRHQETTLSNPGLLKLLLREHGGNYSPADGVPGSHGGGDDDQQLSKPAVTLPSWSSSSSFSSDEDSEARDMSWLAPPTGSVGFYKGRPIVPVAIRDGSQLVIHAKSALGIVG